MTDWVIEEPAIVSANDAPAEIITDDPNVFVPPSMVPILVYSASSLSIALGSFLVYTGFISGLTTKITGTNWRVIVFAAQITWWPNFMAALWYVIIKSSGAWGLLKKVQSIPGAFYFNWLGLWFSQYERAKDGTFTFFSSGNIIALLVALAYNNGMIFVNFMMARLIDTYSDNYFQAMLAYEGDSEIPSLDETVW